MRNCLVISSRKRGRLAAVLAGGVCVLAMPSLAQANSYHDFLCRIPYGPHAGAPAPDEGVTFPTNGTFVYAGNSCPSGGSLYAQMTGESHPYATSASNVFTAPAGLEISGFTLWRYETAGPSQTDGTAETNMFYSPGPPSVQGLCDYGCHRGTQADPLTPENEVSVGSLSGTHVPLSGVTQIQWRAACGGGPGGECPPSGSSAPSAQYEVYAADIDLVDNTPPTASDVGGPLVAGGTLTGNQSVSFEASDGQSGVYGGSLVVDGDTVVSQILNTNEGKCQSLGVTTDGQRSFEYAQPCAPSVSASLTLDTSTLAAGQHSLELIVEDAAGNQTIAYDGAITVGGSSSGSPGVIGPGSPAALRGAPNGANASDQATLTARWASRGTSSRAGGGTGKGGGTSQATLTGRYGTRERVTGTLINSAGQPITGASLDVYEVQAYEGAKTVPLAGTSTGPTGAWTLTLPATISSATLSFAYRSHVNDTVPVATDALKLNVHAGLTLHISPHTTSVGRKIFFSGSLHGAPIPPGGKQLELEASSGGEWIQFDTIGTNAKGRYRASYRFKFPGPVIYHFRVVSPYEADFPFLSGTSNRVAVHER